MEQIKVSFPGCEYQATPWELQPIDIQGIATYTSRSAGFAYSIVNEPDFPRPITLGERNRRWLKGEVVSYFKSKAELTTHIQIDVSSSNLHYLPKSVEFRERKAK
jgi:predicted DNA-binding transcriptional regulator AlpA